MGQVLVQVKKDLPFAGFALGLDRAPGICTGDQNEMPAMGAAQFPIEGAGWARNVLVQTIASNQNRLQSNILQRKSRVYKEWNR